MTPSRATAGDASVIVYAAWYQPAFKGGGPIGTFEALVRNAPAAYDVRVITRDTDQGDPTPLPVAADTWSERDGAVVRTAIVARLRSLASAMKLSQVVACARRLMLGAGVVLTVAGLSATPLLAGNEYELHRAYALTFIGVLLNSAFASRIHALQAVSVGRWSVVRLAKPLSYAVVIGLMPAVGLLSLIGVAYCLVVSLFLQFICRGCCSDITPSSMRDPRR